jgi:hypothetical protein
MFVSLATLSAPRFVEVGGSAGLDFTHDNGMQGELWIVEVMGPGVGILDFDGDGWLDLWLVQGGPLQDPNDLNRARPGDRLFRNVSQNEGLWFKDVTRESGVVATGYGLGIGTGDIDNDGDFDVILTNFGENQLYENLGDGRFKDITAAAGVAGDELSVSASFADVDGDELIDLYIANYLNFTLENHRVCPHEDGRMDYCGPQMHAAVSDRLYRNRGGGRFEDVSRKAGIEGAHGGGLGVVAHDFNADGRTDFYVANDQTDNLLWLNQGNGRFVNDALFAGAAVNLDGLPEASMGVNAADFDGDGDADLFMTHLNGETNTLYVNDGQGWFTDSSAITGVAISSIPYTGFGTGWIDVDNDGDLDLFSANGAVKLIEVQRKAGVVHPLRERNQLWLNDGHGRYEEVDGGPAFQLEEVSRGAAFGDLDNDGDIDIVVANNQGPARIYRNDSDPAHWLGIELRGGDGRPQSLGASAWREAAPRSRKRAGTDGSYASASDPRLLFGLGSDTSRQFVLVQWPDGTVQRFGPLDVDRYHLLARGDLPVTGEP